VRETIGHYRILDRIGTGVIGDVYRARDTKFGRTVAIRVLNEAVARDPARRRRFLDDARAAAAVSHPNIAALYEVGESPDLLYLVSEFIPGETLRTIMGGRPINPRRAVDLAAQVADALAQAHAQGMAHGDLRPETIIVTPKGSAKIMEPGFAAWAGEASIGEGAGVGLQSDIALLGAVLFEMLTGRPPFAGALAGAPVSPGGVAWPAPSSVNRELPAEVDPIVAKMLAEQSEDGFVSAAVLAAELRSLATVLGARSEPDEHSRAAGVTRPRGSWLIWVFALLVLCAIGALIWLAIRAS
jgi:serine/threonine-protein kinase